MELSLFDEVGDAVRSLLPDGLDPHHRAHRYGIKLWFGSATPGREHYEAQVIGAKHVAEAKILALEVGFHIEHPKPGESEAALRRLLESEPHWRKVLGPEAIAGPFIGRPDAWRRLSETWADPDLGEPDLALEIATRLTDYVTALEPLRRKG
jgi:hypothetical protein